MIDKIQIIRNVGMFGSHTGTTQTNFKKLTLIYAENGRGKTTLSAIFRSFESNDPLPILERKRLSATDQPHIVLCADGSSSPITFQNGAWSRSCPNLRVFDDSFIHSNVYSGLEVTPDHRQNLHQLVIGRQGVELAKKVELLTSEITKLQSDLRNKGNELTAEIRGGFSVDEFCDLSQRSDINEAIEQTKKRIGAYQQSAKVQATQVFEPFEPPAVDFDWIEKIASLTLASIDADAQKAVQSHFEKVGEGAESWVAYGVSYVSKTGACPFCSQSVSGIQLVEHYRAYFSQAYETHKASIKNSREELGRVFGENAFVRFNRLVTAQRERHSVWSQLLTLPSFELDMDELTSAWQDLRRELESFYEQKNHAPLEAVRLTESFKKAVTDYRNALNHCRALSKSLVDKNQLVSDLKEETASGDLATALNDLKKLEAIKIRFTSDVSKICTDYLTLKEKKDKTESDKAEARDALDAHRREVFPKYQIAINEYLRKFNAGFRIVEVQPVNPRGAPSSTYQIEISNTRVQLIQQNPEEPAFKNTLSAGDRNTLALAFFFASLDQEPALGSLVTVIDDPVSSLDDGRTLTTAQEIRDLAGKVSQVILLSHSKRTLCTVWDRFDKSSSASLTVVPNSDGSIIESWNVNDQAVTEYDRQHDLLRRYVTGQEREIRKVAQALRHVLEGYLRVVCTEHFPPGSQIGHLTGKAKELARQGKPILSSSLLSELESITEYANKFHHDTNNSWDVMINNINEQELKGFAERVLVFTNNRMAVG